VIDDEAIREAAAAIARGELVVLPTDTVYGIGARPDDARATAAIFEAKGRPRDLMLPVLVATVEEARRAAVFDGRAARLAEASWPGPLTLVLPRTDRSAGWDLGGDGTTIGVRIPGHPVALELLRRTGSLAVTSANRSGGAPAEDREGLVATFGARVAVYLVADAPVRGSASTVVSLVGPEPVILRRGDVAPSFIADLVR
jgi:tRNA threonylcarbamoyl adenosine modification protein (Sua5/YciO/YrdC/YwlC family)